MGLYNDYIKIKKGNATSKNKLHRFLSLSAKILKIYFFNICLRCQAMLSILNGYVYPEEIFLWIFYKVIYCEKIDQEITINYNAYGGIINARSDYIKKHTR